MKYIDEKFKDESPEVTVEHIIKKLKKIGITLEERWNDSKIENCCSLRVSVKGKMPGTNGKGITKDFARASAYGEFMERLESGLFFYKYQSFENDESVFLHSFASDKRYMTVSELLENSEWMEPIVKKYGITKENIANHCKIYASSDKILMLPFYSLFENKYVYLPAGFMEHIYAANGVCVGNTKEEAWVHGLSEILERHSNIEVIKKGKAVPIIPRKMLEKFATINKILKKIEDKGIYDVEILDFSCGKKFPIIAARIINKKSKGYLMDVGADPVFEIAVERALTELFQGKNLDNFTSKNNGVILNKPTDMKVADNIFNELETGNGLYTVDYFADFCENETDLVLFSDNSNKTNPELLQYMLSIYKNMGLQVYVRNNSFLDFPCYKFVVPGFSESRGEWLKEDIPVYYFADRASKTLKNIKKANILELSELLMYHKMVANIISKKNNFAYLSGLPLNKPMYVLTALHFAFAALKTQNYKLFNSYIDSAIKLAENDSDKDYFAAVKQWIEFKNNGVSKEVALTVIEKFYFADTFKRLTKNLENNALLDEFLVECNKDCANCKYRKNCCYESIREMMAKAGAEYAKFTDGQARENFKY